MKLSDFNTLSEAQAYSELKTKLISGSQMKIFVVGNGLYSYFKNHAGDLQAATYDELRGGEFNFINGHPSNVCAMLDAMIALSASEGNVTLLDGTQVKVSDALTNLKNAAIVYANGAHKPFESVTQEQFDQAKAALTPKSILASTNITTGDDTHYLINNGAREKHKVTITVSNASQYDDVFTVTALTKNNADDDYAVDSRIRGSIALKAGETAPITLTVNNSDLLRRVKYRVASKYDRDFTATAQTAVS
ncbi:hypothetical protein J7384_17065 [Endozoicomonas sp. G2_1]|uniref:hypothetical protein n=1 Tax=Endozoicomonas sp. G2_1 TaxID=2821091 RepID=UPI001ADC47E9|nr:hypothetical protein [Endozoicomonas sp. G2_1]MBO9492075.1 hypothetical protein [Endozoicomonas sp. G2_1]